MSTIDRVLLVTLTILAIVTSFVAGSASARPRRFLKFPQIWVALTILFFIGILVIVIPSPTAALKRNAACVSGNISVQGSSAFEPVAYAIAQHYMSMCPASTIAIMATDSRQAVANIVAAGKPTAKTGPGTISIAMSDGQASNATPDLVLHPEAIVIFSVIVNSSAGIHSLTLGQIRAIYSGRITNWDSLGGPNQRIIVVSRERASGTRATFDQKVLGPGRRIRAVETTSTNLMLTYVDGHPGAIGYAATADSSSQNYPNVIQLQLDGVNPNSETVKNGLYPFWAVENFYTNGAPAHGGLLAAFLKYLMSDTSRAIMQDFGHVPCQDAQGGTLVLCTRDIKLASYP